MVVGIVQQVVECTVDGVVLARLDLYRVRAHGRVVVNQIVDLALLALVVVEELVTVGTQLLRHHALIDAPEVDAAYVVEYGTYVVVIELAGEQPHIVQVEFQQVLLQRLAQRENRIGDGVDGQRDARGYEVLELLLVLLETVALLAANLLCHNAFLLVLHLRGYHLVDAADEQLFAMLLLVFGGIGGVEGADAFLHLADADDVVRFEVGVDGIGHSAHQQIAAEEVHHVVVVLHRETLAVLIGSTQHIDGLCAEAVGDKELLEVELEHLLGDDAADGDGGGVLQRDAQQAAAGDVAVAAVFAQEFQHGEVLRVVLDFVEEHQCVVAVAQPVARHHAEGEVEVLLLVDVLEELVALVILDEVDFNEVLIQPRTHLADAERFANLAGTL